MFAYLNEYPIILNVDKPPEVFDFFEPDFNLGQFGFEPVEYELNLKNSVKTVGVPKFQVWQKLFFMLSMSGLCPLSLKAKIVRIAENNQLKIATHRSRVIKCNFNKLFVFDNENVKGLPCELSDRILSVKVTDWFEVRRGNKHDIDYIKTGEDFVREVFFYKAKNRTAKDVAAISKMFPEQLLDPDYTDTFVRFKTLSLMKENGIKGTANGKNPRKPSESIYYLPQIEFTERDIEPVYDFKSFKEGDITFIALSPEEISTEYCLHHPTQGYLYKQSEQLAGDIYIK